MISEVPTLTLKSSHQRPLSLPGVVSNFQMIKNYLSLVKFSHTVFALPFALIGYFIAVLHDGYSFNWQQLALVLLCMVFARNAAMAFNRYADRDIDAKNQRTALREIPKGIISARASIWFVIINGLLFIATTWLLNPLCFFLSPVALTVILGYSYTKRFTALCHFILGLGLSLAPIGAYLAITAHFALLPVLYSIAVMLWVAGFDIIYAMQDDEFDLSHSLYSIPRISGRNNALLFSSLLHLGSLFFIYFAGWLAHFGPAYWIGCLIFTALLLYQHTLVKPKDLSRINLAFFTTNGIASVIFSVFVILDMWMHVT